MQSYRAPAWLPGGHAQTIWPALFARTGGRGRDGPNARIEPAAPQPGESALRFRRERWPTPDGDFIDVDRLDDGQPATGRPTLVLFHGLEGSVRSHYAQAFAGWALTAGWAFALPHFRGCSGELNLAPRAYHSGDFEEVGWMLGRLREATDRPLVAVGVSLGGNALLRWAEEAGESAARSARAVAAVCSPVDLAASGASIDQGLNRLIYARMFLRTMKPKARAKWQQHPGLFDLERAMAATTLHRFDDAFTAPLHGFAGVDDYWRRASAKPQLARIRIPALVLNARNDPFVPARSLPAAHEVGAAVTLWQPAQGGHVGFPAGRFPGHVATLPQSVMGWVQAAAG